MKLLSDAEVAAQLGWSPATIRHRRYLERGRAEDLIPRWVETPGATRPRVRGTTQEEVDAWVERNISR